MARPTALRHSCRRIGRTAARRDGAGAPCIGAIEENDAAKSSAAVNALPLFEARPDAAVGRGHSDALRDALAALDPDRMSLREALDWVYQLQELADKNDGKG